MDRPTEYTVKVRLPGTDETRVSSFPTDIEAVRFMERAVRHRGRRLLSAGLPMPDTPDLTLDAAIKRANQYTRKAIEKPDIGGFWDELAAFAIKNMKDEGHE